jgi:hypothetical protein
MAAPAGSDLKLANTAAFPSIAVLPELHRNAFFGSTR